MGIPFYFATLIQKHANIISKNKPDNINIYCLDFNGVIHMISKKTLDTANFTEKKLIETLFEKILNDMSIFNPSHTFICVDGVVPVAKMIQQRKRRYLKVFSNKIDNISPKWDSNAITPGTKFMNQLDKYFKQKTKKYTNIIYSGSDEYGEGEHKIFDKIINVNNEYIVINGLDADLIILSLMSNKQNIYLMREDNETIYLNVDKLRYAILEELKIKWDLNDYTLEDIYSNISNEIIESYCVMCSLMGNDFIPHLLTLNFKENGLDKLITFTGKSIKTNGMLVSNNNINYQTIIDIFMQISQTEDADMHENMDKYVKYKINNNNIPSEFYGYKNKPEFINEIYSNIRKWRYIYYKNLFDTNILLDSSTIQLSCYNYIYGIYWTYSYYKKMNYDNTWYYPYQFPPTVKDIANYVICNNSPEMIENKLELNSDLQLMIVLPKESKKLINPKYHKYMEDEKSGMYHYYPSSYKIQTFLKKHLWECEPILPILNINYIRMYIK